LNINILDKSCREDQKHTFYVQKLLLENCVVYEMMWKNTVDLDRPQMTILHMCIACCIPTATNTHSEYVTLFHSNSGYMNVPQCYVISKLFVLLYK